MIKQTFDRSPKSAVPSEGHRDPESPDGGSPSWISGRLILVAAPFLFVGLLLLLDWLFRRG
jgi:hypothetical protein